MLSLETLTRADLENLLPASNLRQAYSYVARVQDPVRSGQFLSAQVRDTYLCAVEIRVDAVGLRANCGCCQTMSGYCRHSSAVLLKWIHDPSSFAIDPEVVLDAGYPLEVNPVDPPPARRPTVAPAWLTVSFADRQQQDLKQLEKWLNLVSLSDLRAMARQRGWKIKGTRKSDVVRQVVSQITDPAGIRRAIAGLDAEHRQVLRALVVLGGDSRIPPEDLERVASIWGPLKGYKQVTTYTRHLWQAGLALPGTVRDSDLDWNDLVPPTMMQRFPPLLDDVIPAATNLPASTSASGLRLAEPLALVRAAAQIAVLLEQSPVHLRPPRPRPRLERLYPELKDWDYDLIELAAVDGLGQLKRRVDLSLTVLPPEHSLPDEVVEYLAPIAGGPGTPGEPGTPGGEAQVDLIYALLVAVGILLPGSPTTIWPEVKIEFLRRDELAQRALLARAYLQLKDWNEMWDVLRTTTDLKLKHDWRYSYVKPQRLAADLLKYRHLVLRTLASLPEGRWVTMADLAPLMQAMLPRFDSSPGEEYLSPASLRGWFLARDGNPLQPDNAVDWDLAQGNFIRQIIGGPLHWLGFADLYLDGEKLFAFRLHGLADLYWDRVEVPPLPRHAADLISDTPLAGAVTTDDLAVRVNPSAVSAQAHSLLDKIARLEVADADCFVYRLDVQAAYEAFERGAVLSDIMDDWAQLLPVPMNEPIRARLTAWWETYGRVRIYEDLTIVEFADDYVLAEMKAVTSLEQFLVAEISPRLVIIRPEGIEPLVSQLERAGYTPRQTEDV